MTIPNPWQTPTVTIIEAGRILGIGRDGAYKAADSGVLPTIGYGVNKRRVPTAAIYRLLGLPIPQPTESENLR